MSNSSQSGKLQLGAGQLGGLGGGTNIIQVGTLASTTALYATGLVALGLGVVETTTLPSSTALLAGIVTLSPESNSRVTVAMLEVTYSPTGSTDSRVTTAFLEAGYSPVANSRVTEAFLEIFFTPAVAAAGAVAGGGGHHKVYIPTPNRYDCCLWGDQEMLRRLKLLPPSCPTIEDWDGRTIPSVGDEFFVTRSIVTPAPGADNVVLQFRPGPGQQGIVYGIVFWYTGTGFVPGSGDIIWRLQAGRVWARNFGSVSVPLGAPGGPWPIQDYIPIRPGQTFTISVNVPNLSGLIQVGASQILCSLQGWTWPQL